MQAFATAQQLLIDDVPLLPTYENGLVYVQHPQLRGVARNVFGPDPNFLRAYVVEPEGEAAGGKR
jgi:oligopeptide transport system substrate-binding protein